MDGIFFSTEHYKQSLYTYIALLLLQINTVMRECVWAYMRENVPSPALFTRNEASNVAWRDTDTSIPNTRFIEILRLILLANIHNLGPLYSTLFFNEHK